MKWACNLLLQIMNVLVCALCYFDILESNSIKAAERCIKISQSMITNSNTSLFRVRDLKGTEKKLHLPQTLCSTFISAATPSTASEAEKEKFHRGFLILISNPHGFHEGKKCVQQKFRQASGIRSLENNVNNLAIL